MGKVKTAGQIILGIGVMVLLLLILHFIFESAEIKEVSSSTPGVTLYRTGSGTILPIIMGMGAVTVGLLIGRA